MSTTSSQTTLTNARRVVIKIGSALLVDAENGALKTSWLKALTDDIAALTQQGKQVVLVSSGAVALGLSGLGLSRRTSRLEDAQAAAAIGQIKLAQAYQSAFADSKLTIAQILLSIDDLEHRPRYLNARNTVETLLENGVIPVINENDSVATSEIRFGDNDRLAARVAQMMRADLLLLLSDIDGLYSADPRKNAEAKLISHVSAITPKIEAMAGPPAEVTVGTGGMITKIMAAKIALTGGCSMVIMDGRAPSPIRRLLGGEQSTLFTASGDPLTLRKQWIQGMMAPRGFVHIDAGAVAALKKGASLLPAGVTSVEGTFRRGDMVACMGPNGDLFAQGLISYDAEDADRIAGVKSSDVITILGYAGRASLIHRDDLVII